MSDGPWTFIAQESDAELREWLSTWAAGTWAVRPAKRRVTMRRIDYTGSARVTAPSGEVFAFDTLDELWQFLKGRWAEATSGGWVITQTRIPWRTYIEFGRRVVVHDAADAVRFKLTFPDAEAA